MKHHVIATPLEKQPMLPELVAELARVRAKRAFDPITYLARKVQKIVSYLHTHRLHGAVVGLSGGIDSAVVLGILLEVQRAYPETLLKVIPVMMPVYRTDSTTGQLKGAERADLLCEAWNIEPVHYDLADVFEEYQRAIHLDDRIPKDYTKWADGQLVSYLRTPALYYTTSCLTAAGTPSVVVGTTNRDEGAYLGYVGKASDGMVDLQIIADLHKSEVRKLAAHLGVHQSIMDVTPTGDMYDGRVDEEVFGAPYDFVELYLNHLVSPLWVPTEWSKDALKQYLRLSENLEALHRYNAHKYLVGSPAVHLNVLESAVPGGWKE